MRRAEELKTIHVMIEMFCRARHRPEPRSGHRSELCEECSRLAEYAAARLGRCPWGEAKPTCGKCSIHCYIPEMRRRVKEVMRFSGPRMLYRHPVLGLRHFLRGKKSDQRQR